VLNRIESERRAIVTTANQLHLDLSLDEHKKIQRLSTPIIEQFLDTGTGACHLRNPLITDELANTLRYFDEKRYRLFAWCIMPNHVHVVVRLLPGQSLADTIHSWKSFSAKQANRAFGAHGAFWQREYYDHLIRSEEELERAVRYVAENPAKANLRHWMWVWVCERDARTTAAEDGGATRTLGL